MSEFPWVKFYPSDWLAGTRGMSALETGVYITLIATMYEKQAPIKEDTGRLARVCGASNSAFKKALAVLVDEGKIDRANGLLWNDRVGREVEKRAEKSEVARQNAHRRWADTDEKTQQKQCPENADAEHQQYNSDANQKSETRGQITTVTARPDLDDLTNRLLDAGGDALRTIKPGMFANLSLPLGWLDGGADLELDILPTMRRLCHGKPPGSVKGWRYFTEAIAEAKADRETRLPEVAPNAERTRTNGKSTALEGLLAAGQEAESGEPHRAGDAWGGRAGAC